jgi:hypothetical protein
MGEYGVLFQNEPIDVSEEFAPRSAHLRLEREVDAFALKDDPLQGREGWTVRTAAGGHQDA